MKTILSYGMGVESSSLLVYWCKNRSRLDFDLSEDLIAVTAMTGDEHIDTKIQVERAILPRLREHDIRYVQVARAGHLESDGIIFLDDTREPRTVYLDGAYKLSDELRAAGTLPQYAGEHRCALKFKSWTIQKWIEQELAGDPYRHAIGYNAEERKRIEKSERTFAEREPVRVAFGFNADEGDRINKGMKLEKAEYALYRVRRIYSAPGRADRAVERLDVGSRGEMISRFEQISLSLDVRVEHDIRYGYVRERQPYRYPAHEEFFVVGLAVVESKTRYGFEWFEAKWKETLGETGQERQFD